MTVLDIPAMQAQASQATAFLKALAHPDRLVLLCQLSKGESCVSDLEQKLGLHQPSLSQQLNVLRQEGVVATRKEGKHVFYRLTSGLALDVLQQLQRHFCSNTSQS